ncbi:hypothetical protein ACFL9U_04830 [Thermodesulfobacteriota bacterium]
MEKTKLIEIIRKLLDVDEDLGFLEKLKKSELETLVAYVRDKVDNLGK